jgi:hypothetical protein
MKLCYVDESGDTGLLPNATAPIQPVFVIAGLIVDREVLRNLTLEFLQLKVHVGLQLADLVLSVLLFPMATSAYCTGYMASSHVLPGFESLQERYGVRLKAPQTPERNT